MAVMAALCGKACDCGMSATAGGKWADAKAGSCGWANVSGESGELGMTASGTLVGEWDGWTDIVVCGGTWGCAASEGEHGWFANSGGGIG